MAAVLESAPAPTISQSLARFVAALRPADVPGEVRRRARHLMLDALGCALAAVASPFARTALAGISALGGKGDCTVIGHAQRLPARDAALMNGILAHGLDYDDTHSAGVIHLTVAILPALLARAQERDLDDGRAFVTAYVAAMECGARIASAAQGGLHQVGFHPTGLVGAFAAALAAGKLDDLSEHALTDAQGIALSVGAGSLQFLDDGSWTKRMHPGWAGVGGLTAAALAQAGFPAPREAYEGRFGLYASHIGPRAPHDPAMVSAGLGRVWETLNVAVKPYPLCHLVHACTDAAAILSREVRGSEIVRVRARVPAGVVPVICEPLAAKRHPVTDYDAKFSLPYCVATALLRGKLGLAELGDDALADPATRALMQRVGYQVDDSLEYPRYYGGEVSVTLADGRSLTERQAINRGSAERPLSDAEIVAKFRDNAAAVLAPAQIDRVQQAMLDIESGGVAPLLAALAPD